MAELDIRDGAATEIDTIRFGVNEIITERGSNYIGIWDSDDFINGVDVLKKDIPNLIKALQKAQELWSASE